MNNNKEQNGKIEKIYKYLDIKKHGHDEHSSISLLKFSRLYTFGSVPIIDFISIFLIFYVLNQLTYHYKFSTILFFSIAITICINLIFNKETMLNLFICITLIICLYYLLSNSP